MHSDRLWKESLVNKLHIASPRKACVSLHTYIQYTHVSLSGKGLISVFSLRRNQLSTSLFLLIRIQMCTDLAREK